MRKIQSRSESALPSRDLFRLALETARRAEAMGLIPSESVLRGDLASIQAVAARVGRAGIATATAAALSNVESSTPEELSGLLGAMIAALEDSPAPKFEWAAVTRVLDPETLAALLNVSISSLKRYHSAERETPDPIAARLHFLALVLGDLAGSYNEIGIRRWFHRKRSQLDGQAPADVLRGDWDPDDSGPARVRQLARELVTLAST